MLDYVFANWPFRKVYVEALEESFSQFRRSALLFGEIEGRLRAHHFVGGRYQDLVTVAIYREAWCRPHRLFERLGVRPGATRANREAPPIVQ